MSVKALRAGLLLISVVQLTGCAVLPAYQIVMWGAVGFSYATSVKSLTDHVVSSALQRDCAFARLLNGHSPCHDQQPESRNVTAKTLRAL